MKDLLDNYVETSSDDEAVNTFMNLVNEKVIPTYYSETYYIDYKGSEIKFLNLVNRIDDQLLGYIKNSSYENEYLNILDELFQESVLICYSNDPDKIEIVKSKESEYTELTFIILLEKSYTEEEIAEIIYLTQVNQLYIQGNIGDDEYLKITSEFE